MHVNNITTLTTLFQYSCETSSWKSSGSNTYDTVCGLTPAVGQQCSVRVDDVIQTEIHKNLKCSGKLMQHALTENYQMFGLKNRM